MTERNSAVAVGGGVSARGMCLPRGVCLLWGVSAQGGAPVYAGIAPPPVNRMTDACENKTFPQLLLRTVNIIRADPLLINKQDTVY